MTMPVVDSDRETDMDTLDSLKKATELAERIAREAPDWKVAGLVRYADWWEIEVYAPNRVLYIDSLSDWRSRQGQRDSRA